MAMVNLSSNGVAGSSGRALNAMTRQATRSGGLAQDGRDSRPNSRLGENGSVVLRIKRKRGTDPIMALRIEALMSEGLDVQQAEQTARQELSPSSPPLDHHQVMLGTSPDERAARTKRQMTASQGIFQLAETVSMDSFDSADSTQRLQERIRRRIRQRPARLGKASGSRPGTPAQSSLQQSTGSLRSIQSSTENVEHATERRSDTVDGDNRKSLSSAGKAHGASHGTMRVIDAILDHPRSTVPEAIPGSRKDTKANLLQSSPRDVEMDSLDRRFADLLGDFLRDQDLEPPSDLESTSARNTQEVQQEAGDSDDEDYVYDIYYRVRESFWASGKSGSEGRGSALGADGTARSDGLLNGINGDQNIRAGPPIVADLLPTATLVDPLEQSFFMDDSEEMQAEIEQGSKLVADERYDSDHPFDDGEDEDSNDEDFYKNDYPEDEAGDDDEDAFDTGFGSSQRGSRAFGWSGPRRRAHRSNLYDSDGSEGAESDEDDFI